MTVTVKQLLKSMSDDQKVNTLAHAEYVHDTMHKIADMGGGKKVGLSEADIHKFMDYALIGVIVSEELTD